MHRLGTAILLVAVLAANTAEARVKTLYTAPGGEALAIDPLDAVTVIASRNGYSYVGWVCDPTRMVPPASLAATGGRLIITCADRTQVVVPYGQTATVAVAKDSSIQGVYVAINRSTAPLTVTIGFTETDQDLAIRVADAWKFLAGARPMIDPAADPAFEAQVLAERTQSADTESLRRVQVQVEALLREGRALEAARMYRDRLQTAASWAEGHYNLALLYGELELYPEAVNEMRRYLHLAPGAADARAAQDQIYQWEALVP